MFIHLKTFQTVFPDNRLITHIETDDACISGYARINKSQSPHNLHVLYIAFGYEEVWRMKLTPDMYLLIIEKPDTRLPPLDMLSSVPLNYIIVFAENEEEIYQKIEDFFFEKCSLGIFADSLLESLFSETGIQAMIEHIYPAFQNPITVFDAGFQIIAATWDELGKTESGKRLIENGGFSDQDFKNLNRISHFHEKFKKSDAPIRVSHDINGFEQLMCNIDVEKDMGHIVINATNRPFQPMDETMLYLLKKAIDQQMKKDEFIRNTKGFHYEYFLRDLLDGKIAVSSQHMDRLNYTNEEFRSPLYCLVVETARNSIPLNQRHICNEFETLYPNAKTLIYNGEIIIILSKSNSCSLLPKEYKKLDALCTKHGIYTGISNCFASITQLKDYYKQALRAIEIGICEKNAPGLFVYQNYYRQHIANIFRKIESVDTFCHPKLKYLMEYDQQNDTQLSRTLYMYLIHERNCMEAAKAMYIHRNTMVYRLKKIDSMVMIDYDDYEERQYLILSYQLNIN